MYQLASTRNRQPVLHTHDRKHNPAQNNLALSRRVKPQDSQYEMCLLDAFSDFGEVVDGDALSNLLRDRFEQPISKVARWIVQREVISFQWHSQTLLPMFQFDLQLLLVRPGVSQVIAVLREAVDDAELANWFVRPNNWLLGSIPALRIEVDLPAVLQAAHAARFEALGTRK